MILTRQIIHSAGTSGCGFNKEQLKLLGVNWPPPKGWLTRLCGADIPEKLWDEVVRLKDKRARRQAALQFQWKRDAMYR